MSRFWQAFGAGHYPRVSLFVLKPLLTTSDYISFESVVFEVKDSKLLGFPETESRGVASHMLA